MVYPTLLLSLTGGTRWSGDPTRHRHRAEQRRCFVTTRRELDDGEFAGGEVIRVGPT